MIWNESSEAVIAINQTICEKLNSTLFKPNVFVGSIYLTLSFIFQAAYLPCLITFLQRDFRYHSCFKLMFVIGVIDMITTNNDLTIAGYFSIVGFSYCRAPNLSSFLNFIALTSWYAHCSLCIILNFNRCCNLYFGRTVAIFTKSRLWVWVGLAFFYANLMYILSPKGFYHSDLGIWLNNLDRNEEPTESLAHLINNVTVAVIIMGQYVFMAIILRQRLNTIRNRSIRSKPESHVLIQSVIICFVLVTCSTLYITIGFVYLPPAILPLIHISWMVSQGGKGILYIAMNSSVRRNIRRIICIRN